MARVFKLLITEDRGWRRVGACMLRQRPVPPMAAIRFLSCPSITCQLVGIPVPTPAGA